VPFQKKESTIFLKRAKERKQGKIERKNRKMSVVKVTVVLSCIVFLCCALGQVHGFRRMNPGFPELSNLNGKVTEAVKALELNSAETVRRYHYSSYARASSNNPVGGDASYQQ